MNEKVFLLCLIIVAVGARPQQDTDKTDNVNMDEIQTANRLLMVTYIKCALDQDKCSLDGEQLKSHVKEAFENFCAKCTNLQRDRIRRLLSHLMQNGPDYWKQRLPTLIDLKSQQFM